MGVGEGAGAGARIVGTGWAVPANVRTNDDPIFDWLKKHHPHGQDLFKGYKDRRVLAEGEGLDTLTVPAALQALEMAKVAPADVDLLMGTCSAGPYVTPDELARLPALLRMAPRVWTVPLRDDFSNYNAALWFADALVRAGRIRTALVVCAGDWTRRVDYHTPQSISAADGAGAAVITATTGAAGGGGAATPQAFEVVDCETTTDASWFGTMYMQGEEVRCGHEDDHEHGDLYTKAFFQITEAGQEGFQTFGAKEPPKAAARLLARNGVRSKDVTLISHQASSVLIDAWQQAIQPGAYLHTLEQFANMTVANIPLDVAYYWEKIATDWIVLLAVGIDMHTNAMLLKRA
jgi:3-oxoacyl-[acyl-carrier-protein] synthase III